MVLWSRTLPVTPGPPGVAWATAEVSESVVHAAPTAAARNILRMMMPFGTWGCGDRPEVGGHSGACWLGHARTERRPGSGRSRLGKGGSAPQGCDGREGGGEDGESRDRGKDVGLGGLLRGPPVQ